LGNSTFAVFKSLLLKTFGFSKLLALGLEILGLPVTEHGLFPKGGTADVALAAMTTSSMMAMLNRLSEVE
jgi:hypothetical protein